MFFPRTLEFFKNLKKIVFVSLSTIQSLKQEFRPGSENENEYRNLCDWTHNHRSKELMKLFIMMRVLMYRFCFWRHYGMVNFYCKEENVDSFRLTPLSFSGRSLGDYMIWIMWIYVKWALLTILHFTFMLGRNT